MALPFNQENAGYDQGTYTGFSEVYELPVSSGGGFSGGTSNATFAAPVTAYVPKTLSTIVTEGLHISNGDDAATSTLSGDYVDNRGAGIAWQNIVAAYESDDNYATVELASAEVSAELFIQGFGFDVPADAELLGIEIIVERSLVRGVVASDLAAVGTCAFPSAFNYFDNSYWVTFGAFDATWSGVYWYNTIVGVGGSDLKIKPVGGWSTSAFRPSSVDVSITPLTDLADMTVVATIGTDEGGFAAGDQVPITFGQTVIINIDLIPTPYTPFGNSFKSETDFIS